MIIKNQNYYNFEIIMHTYCEFVQNKNCSDIKNKNVCKTFISIGFTKKLLYKIKIQMCCKMMTTS